VWAAGFLAFALRFVRGSARVAAVLRRSVPSSAEPLAHDLARSLGIRRPVRVRESADSAVPMAWGVLRASIILPAGAAAWPEPQLRSVLLHELVHITRLDALTQGFAQLTCCLYWINPLVWMAERKLRDERERACDDAVLRIGVAPADYAGHLLEIARGVPTGTSLAPAMAEISGLEARVRALLDRRRDRRPVSRAMAAVALGAALAVLIPLAAFRAEAQASRGTIVGVVQDPSGAVIPNCSVMARNLTGSNQETTTANLVGEFRFNAIPSGRYALEVRAAGFKLFTKEFVLEADQSVRADVTLDVGQVSERMVITGKRPAAPAMQATGGAPRRIRVGGNVQATKLVKMARPTYPENLQQLGIEGSVLLRAVVSTDGSLLNLAVANTDVHPGLAKAAMDAVSQWAYQPTLLNGQPVEVVTTVTVEFRLER
jgi:TonB family protein